MEAVIRARNTEVRLAHAMSPWEAILSPYAERDGHQASEQEL